MCGHSKKCNKSLVELCNWANNGTYSVSYAVSPKNPDVNLIT